MNSEFPMSFQDDSKTSKSSKSKSSFSKLSLVPLSQAYESVRDKSNKQDSMHDYPQSQFGEEQSDSVQRKTSGLRWFVRGFLLTILAGLWVAIGTGHLTSDSDEVEAIRALISSSEKTPVQDPLPSQASNDTRSLTNASAGLQQNLTAEGAQPSDSQMPSEVANGSQMNGSQPAAMNRMNEGQAAAQGPSTQVQANSQTQTPSTQGSSGVPSASALSSSKMEKVPPVPAADDELSISDSDVKKTSKFLKQQQKQMFEMEEHLTSMIAHMGDSELAERHLQELEAQYLQAAKKLRDQRTKLRQ